MTYAKRSFHSAANNKETAEDLEMLFICFLDIPKSPNFIEVFNSTSTYVFTHIDFSSGNPLFSAPGHGNHLQSGIPPGLRGHQAGWHLLLQLPLTN